MSTEQGSSLRILVCARQIIDPLTTAAEFAIDSEAMRAILPKGRALVISDYDEVAVEAAVRIKEAHGGEITVMSLGEESAKDALRRGIAMGADEGVLLKDPMFDNSDSFATAQALALAIKKLGNFDLIFCGRQEGDWDAGQVGSGIAEILNIPCVTVAGKVEIEDRKVIVERVVTEGRDVIELPLPALVTVSSEIGEPRYPSVRRTLAAAKKEIRILNAQDIGYTAKSLNKMLELFVPLHETKCEFIEGKDPEEMGINLAVKLKEDNLI